MPTWNNERTIGKCLSSIRSEIPNATLILVDKFSTDDTVKIGKEYGADIVSLNLSIGEARTWICENAVGEWFVMVDSDVYLTKGWYSKMLYWKEVLLRQDKKLGALGCRVYETPIIKDPKLRKQCSKVFQYLDSQLSYVEKNTGRLILCGALFRKEAVKGFHTHAAAMEDMLIDRYIVSRGFNTYLVPVYVQHEQLIDLENILKRARIMGAWWKETHYTSLIALFKNALFATAKVPYETKILTLKIYIHYIVGWITKEQYIKNYRWSKG